MDFPTPDHWIPKRMGERVIGMLTTDTDDDDFCTLSRTVPGNGVMKGRRRGLVRHTLDMARRAKCKRKRKTRLGKVAGGESPAASRLGGTAVYLLYGECRTEFSFP